MRSRESSYSRNKGINICYLSSDCATSKNRGFDFHIFTWERNQRARQSRRVCREEGVPRYSHGIVIMSCPPISPLISSGLPAIGFRLNMKRVGRHVTTLLDISRFGTSPENGVPILTLGLFHSCSPQAGGKYFLHGNRRTAGTGGSAGSWQTVSIAMITNFGLN